MKLNFWLIYFFLKFVKTSHNPPNSQKIKKITKFNFFFFKSQKSIFKVFRKSKTSNWHPFSSLIFWKKIQLYEKLLFNSNMNYSIFFACFLMGLETVFTTSITMETLFTLETFFTREKCFYSDRKFFYHSGNTFHSWKVYL